MVLLLRLRKPALKELAAQRWVLAIMFVNSRFCQLESFFFFFLTVKTKLKVGFKGDFLQPSD